MQAPIISEYKEFLIKSSSGQHYRLTPNGKRQFGKPGHFIYTFQYRRCDERGNITPRVRQSKKNRIRARIRARRLSVA